MKIVSVKSKISYVGRVLSIVLVGTIVLGLVKGFAAEKEQGESGSLENIFCEALSVEENYDKNNLNAYKMMVAGKDGWVFRSFSDFKTDFPLTTTMIKNMTALHEAFAYQGIEFVLMYPPTRGIVHADKLSTEKGSLFNKKDAKLARKNYSKFVHVLKNRGIQIVGLPDQPVGQDFFYKRDHHWNPVGAKISAQALASYIKTQDVYADLAKTEYATKSTGITEFNGVADKVFKKLCDTILPVETVEGYVTEPVETIVSEADLFGDRPDPEVVLAGTSNSTARPSMANFEGFLKEALSTDVLNASISGGSIDSPMISYLNSDHYKNKKAKIVIWEVPGYYDLPLWEGRVFRQVTPAVYGECQGVDIIAEIKDYDVRTGVSLLFRGLEERKISGSDYYISLDFSEPVTSKFTLYFGYDTKKKDKLSLYRSRRYPYDNQFYVALKENRHGNLSRIVLETPKKMKNLKLNAKLCKIPHKNIWDM